MMAIKHSKGFTLIELMIVVLITSILAAIAYPAYTQYVIRGKRAEARAALMDAAAKQERYYSNANQYGTKAQAGIADTSETGKYNLTVTLSNSNQNFVIQAAPTFSDPECGNLTINHAGVKTESGSTSDLNQCWGR